MGPSGTFLFIKFMQSEHNIQSNIMLEISKHDCTIFRSNAGQVKLPDGRIFKAMPKGFPDLCGFRHSDGKMFFIEVKNEKGRLRSEQIKFKAMAEQYPVLYGVARSVEDAINIING